MVYVRISSLHQGQPDLGVQNLAFEYIAAPDQPPTAGGWQTIAVMPRLRGLRQEDQKFKTSLGYGMKLSLKKS